KVNEDLRVPYDLNGLPCAAYQVMITTDDEEVTYTIETVEKVVETPIVYPLMAYGKKVNDYTANLVVIGLSKAGVD
ncbi:hypothetical protein, partial [Gelidibacter salicanalis]